MQFTYQLPLRIVIILSCIGFASCVATRSVILENAEATTPVAAPPIRLIDNAKPDQFTITPHFSWPSNKNVTGILQLSEEGTHQAAVHDSTDFLWRIPGMTGGLNFDYTMSRHAAFGFGLSLSSLDGRTYGGWTAGVGLFNEKENGAVRFDFGLQSTPFMYSTIARVIQTYDNRNADTTLSFDDGEESNVSFYGALTVNTTRKTWPVNIFLNTYITKQRFVDYAPYSTSLLIASGNDTRISASYWIIGLTPGIFVSLMDDVRLVIGERIIFPLDIVNQTPYPLLQFHMQIDLTM
jgi:hypothetical protein